MALIIGGTSDNVLSCITFLTKDGEGYVIYHYSGMKRPVEAYHTANAYYHEKKDMITEKAKHSVKRLVEARHSVQNKSSDIRQRVEASVEESRKRAVDAGDRATEKVKSYADELPKSREDTDKSASDDGSQKGQHGKLQDVLHRWMKPGPRGNS